MRRLLTIGHSYVVASNRRLAHEMALQGGGRWQVTAVAPARFRGDMREIAIEPIANEASTLRPASIRADRSPHLMWYANRRECLQGDWDVVHCWEEPFVLAAAQIARAVPRSHGVRRVVLSESRQEISVAPQRVRAPRAPAGERVDCVRRDRPRHVDAATSGLSRPTVARDPAGRGHQRFRAERFGCRREMRQTLAWSDEVPTVGFVGRFVPEKGPLRLAAALEAVTTPWRALFVGGGPLEADLRTLCRGIS